MQFGIFYEHQIPRPWQDRSEQQLFQEALDQVELADRRGIDYAWEVEHHFLEEYSHSSAPEVFLAACSQRTKRIRLGHGIVLMPPGYNSPARVAEGIRAQGGNASTFATTEDIINHLATELRAGDHVVIMSNGGFDNIHNRLLERLRGGKR